MVPILVGPAKSHTGMPESSGNIETVSTGSGEVTSKDAGIGDASSTDPSLELIQTTLDTRKQRVDH